MKKLLNMKKNCGLRSLFFIALIFLTAGDISAQQPVVIKNIVLVHGAFVDGSGWKPVYIILSKKGYRVSVVQQPLNSFENDIAAVKRVIDLQDGPCILVAHSYGGAIITVAGNDSKVAGLVYIAAHAPDSGESEGGNGKIYPSAYKSLQKGADGFDYIDPLQFPEDFAVDLSKEQAEFEAFTDANCRHRISCYYSKSCMESKTKLVPGRQI